MKTPFALSLDEILAQLTIKDALHPVRSMAKRRFDEIGLPDKKEDAFQYFPLRSLYEATLKVPSSSSVVDEELIQKHMAPECQKSCIVFVDGHFREELSSLENLDQRVGVYSLEEAMKTFGHFINTRFAKHVKEETDAFALLNSVLHFSGALLYVSPKTVVEHPIQVLHIITQEEAFIAPRLFIFLGAGAEAKLYTSTCADPSRKGLTLDFIDVTLEEAARLDYATNASMNTAGSHMEFVRGSLKRDSYLHLCQVASDTARYRRDIKVDLLGENASANLKGLSLLKNNQQAHTRITINHEAPHTHSSQLFKGILGGSSQSSFEGKILVQRAAQKTQAYQLCNHLLLGEHAIANSKPNLEIFADDVKASHGATVSQLKPEELFYLKSRGIGGQEAKNLLTHGFCNEVIASLFLCSLKDNVSTLIKGYDNSSS